MSVSLPDRIWLTTSIALLIGIANAVVLPDWPKKSSLCAAAVFIPTTLPSVFTSGPPESPGWIGADIWIMPCRVSELPVPSSPAVTFWSSAVTEPWVAAETPRPPALPMATTLSPTLTLESARLTVLSPDTLSIWINATSSTTS